ncbi:MAG: trigger factor [Anaerolineae bacterium]|nr:trigger factor [Gloeobacterales cyanobacterium ES-bin-313]
MKVTQEKLPRSQMGLNVEVEGDQSQKTYEKLVRDYMRTARIPGFRPGKAPRQLVLQFYGKERVKAAALGELIETSLKDAIAQEAITPLAEPQLRESFDEVLGRFQPGQPISFKAAVDIQPEVTLGAYTGLTIKHDDVPYDPATVDEQLTKYQQQRANLVPVEGRPAESGDTAVINFAGTKKADGEPILGGSAEDFSLELLPGKFIAGFVEGLIGIEIGETRILDLTFPEDYAQAELAGQEATFEITLNDLKTKQLPELDDEFAQEISDGDFETLDGLKEFLEKQARTEAEDKTRANRDAAIVAAVVAGITVELPETLVSREVQFLAEQTARNLQQQGIDPNQIFTESNMPRLRESLRTDAESRLKRTLALAQVARVENLVADEAGVVDRVAELQSEVDENISQSALTNYVREELLTEKILDWLAEQSTIELNPKEADLVVTDENASPALEPPVLQDESVAQVPEPEGTDPVVPDESDAEPVQS